MLTRSTAKTSSKAREAASMRTEAPPGFRLGSLMAAAWTLRPRPPTANTPLGAREVVELLAAAARDLGVARPEYLEQRLKAFFPQAVVRAQDSLGGLGSSRETWYVYRDGSALGPID